MISAQVWSWFDASFTMIWVIQIVHGVPKNFQQLQVCQNKAWIWAPLCASYPTHWEFECGACIEFRYFSRFRLITHYAIAGLSFHDGDCHENMPVFLWLRPCRSLYVKGTRLEREQSWSKLACPVHTIGHSTAGRQLEKPANGVIHEKGVIRLNSTIKHEFSTFCMNKTTISMGIHRCVIGWRKHQIFAKNSQVFYTWTKPSYRYVPALLLSSHNDRSLYGKMATCRGVWIIDDFSGIPAEWLQVHWLAHTEVPHPCVSLSLPTFIPQSCLILSYFETLVMVL